MREKIFRIRRSKNINKVKELHALTFPTDHFPESTKMIYWLVFNEEKKAVGFCIISLLEDNIVFMARTGLLSEARKQGLHKRLISVREAYARKENFEIAITYTKIDNITSSVNLQKAGYILYIPEHEYADKDCLYWIKEL